MAIGVRLIVSDNTKHSIVDKIDDRICTVNGHVEHKVKKKLGVALADAVCKPSTVVIHAQNAPFTL